MRITNRLRAIRAREVRWVSTPTYDMTDFTYSEPRSVGRIIANGPYAAWLPVKRIILEGDARE